MTLFDLFVDANYGRSRRFCGFDLRIASWGGGWLELWQFNYIFNRLHHAFQHPIIKSLLRLFLYLDRT
jgi:hypothetical protein